MAKSEHEPKEMRLGKSEQTFFIAIRPPVEYDAETISLLLPSILPNQGVMPEDGSQVYSYYRPQFGWNESDRDEAFQVAAQDLATELGNIALNSEVRKVERGVKSLFEDAALVIGHTR